MKLTRQDRRGIERLLRVGWSRKDIVTSAEKTARLRGEEFGPKDAKSIEKYMDSLKLDQTPNQLSQDLF